MIKKKIEIIITTDIRGVEMVTIINNDHLELNEILATLEKVKFQLILSGNKKAQEIINNDYMDSITSK